MRKNYVLGLAVMLIMLVASMAMAQPGVVMGTVTDTLGVGVDSAYVTLSRGCMGGGGQIMYSTYTGEDGSYNFPAVTPNNYKIKAMKQGVGKDMENITVLAGETLVVNLELNGGGGGGGGGCHPDSLPPINAQGYAMVDTGMCMNSYWLDTDNNGEPDYKLNFGPPWYNPGSGAERPEAGDFITITGGLVTTPDPDVIVVYTINGLFWRNPIVRGQNPHWQNPGDVAGNPAINGAYPNPFNPSTTINFTLPQSGIVNLSVWNLNGQRVAQLINGSLETGTHQITWNAADLASGIYLVRLQASNTVAIKRVVFAK